MAGQHDRGTVIEGKPNGGKGRPNALVASDLESAGLNRTLKSTRMKTTLFLRSRSRMESLGIETL